MWTCDNQFYQSLAPVQWQLECAGIEPPQIQDDQNKAVSIKASSTVQNKLPINRPTTKQDQEPITKKDQESISKQVMEQEPITKPDQEPISVQDQEAVTKLRARIGRYLPVELDVDTSYLNNTQEQVLETLVRAAQFMDKIFELQVKTYLEFTMLPGLVWFARKKGCFGGEGR